MTLSLFLAWLLVALEIGAGIFILLCAALTAHGLLDRTSLVYWWLP